MIDLDHMLGVALAAMDTAVEHVRTRRPGDVTVKGDRDIASEVDVEVERDMRGVVAVFVHPRRQTPWVR